MELEKEVHFPPRYAVCPTDLWAVVSGMCKSQLQQQTKLCERTADEVCRHFVYVSFSTKDIWI